ncbi:MAG: Bug family tripartite tricarboxylate transporter substrate binding protein [Burkholderiales bacterium]
MKIIKIVVAAFFCTAPLAAYPQSYPAKPVHLVIPFSGGGASLDTVARLLATKMSEGLAQPIVVENRPGANGMIGSQQVARMPADGYNILFTSTSTHVTAVFLSKNLPYDPVKDFTPISAAVEPVTTIALHPSVPVQSVRELIDYARKNPGKLSYSSSGIGSVFHLTGELFKQASGIDMVHVPYKVNQQAVTDAVAGRVGVLLNTVLVTVPQAKAGKLRLLAVMEGRRFSGLPEVPTMGESLTGFEKPSSWFGYFGPAALPAPVLARLHTEIVKALDNAEVRARLEAAGMSVIGNTPEQFAALIRHGFEVYGRAVKLAGVEPE